MDDQNYGLKHRRLIFNNMDIIKIPTNFPFNAVKEYTNHRKILWSYDVVIYARDFTYDSLKRLVSCKGLMIGLLGESADGFKIQELPNLVEVSDSFDVDNLQVPCSIPNLKKCGNLWGENSKVINLNSLEEIDKMNTPPLIKDLPSLKKCNGYLSFERNTRARVKVNQPIEGYFDLYVSSPLFEAYSDDDLKDIYGENIQRIYRR